MGDAFFFRPHAGEIDHLPADAPVVVKGQHVERPDFSQLRFVRVEVERDAGDDVLVDLEDVELVDVFLDGLLGAVKQFLALHGVAREVVEEAHVALGGLADLLVVVRVDERADAFAGEYLVDKAVEGASVHDVDARHAGLDGAHSVNGLAVRELAELLGVLLKNGAEGVHGDVALDFTVDLKAGLRSEVDDL